MDLSRLPLQRKSLVIINPLHFGLAFSRTKGIHMIKLRKSRSHYAEDALVVSGLLLLFLALYLALAYLMIRV